MSDTADAKCEKSEFGLKGRKKDKSGKYIVKRPRPPDPDPAPTTRLLTPNLPTVPNVLFILYVLIN